MNLNKEQKRFLLFSTCLFGLLIILGFCLQLAWQVQLQNNSDLKKTVRIEELRNSLLKTSFAQVPEINTLEQLKNSAGTKLVKITQDKDIYGELKCSFQELLAFLQKYSEAPAYIQSLQIVRSEPLLISLRLKNTEEDQ